MARVSTYLNFNRHTEDAFIFYRSVFGGDFMDGITRFGDTPMPDDAPPLSDEDKNLVMHVALEIMGGHVLMGTDAPESMGFHIHPGNNVFINLEPDTREETRRLFEALSEGGLIEQELDDMYWGSYYGCLCDRFGVQWMLNCNEKP